MIKWGGTVDGDHGITNANENNQTKITQSRFHARCTGREEQKVA